MCAYYDYEIDFVRVKLLSVRTRSTYNNIIIRKQFFHITHTTTKPTYWSSSCRVYTCSRCVIFLIIYYYFFGSFVSEEKNYLAYLCDLNMNHVVGWWWWKNQAKSLKNCWKYQLHTYLFVLIDKTRVRKTENGHTFSIFVSIQKI